MGKLLPMPHASCLRPPPTHTYSTCELMLAAVATARPGAEARPLALDTRELAAAAWVGRADLAGALAAWAALPPAAAAAACRERLGFDLPPPGAIAHQLLAAWAGRCGGGPWQPGAGGGEGCRAARSGGGSTAAIRSAL